jgi:NADPH-dependent curcumin reductase CurA
MKNRRWLLARRPHGTIQDSDFNFVETEAPTPGEGEVLVRNLMLSCDPTQRGWVGSPLTRICRRSRSAKSSAQSARVG